jgi:hypothetical protein
MLVNTVMNIWPRREERKKETKKKEKRKKFKQTKIGMNVIRARKHWSYAKY